MYDPEDHVHEFKLTKTLITATCKDDGEGIYTCECGETKTDIIPASEEYHDYVEIPSGVENVKIYKCNICGDVKTELVKEESHEHNYLEIEGSRIEAKCTEEGKIFKQCEICGEKLTETIAKKAHKSSTKAGQGKILTGAVPCTTDGEEEVTCDECHQKFIRPISAHSYEKVAEVPATCTAEGVITYKCKVCGATKAEAIEKIDHEYTTAKVVIPADCQTEGLTLSVCKVCGDEKRTITKKLNHKGTAIKGWAKLDEKGNYILTDDKGEFDPSKITLKDEADCENDLIEAFKCTDCQKIQVKVVAKKLGHRIDSTKDVVVGSIICDEKGVPQKNSEGKYIVTKGGKADCQHAEVKLFTCANCKKEQVVVLTEKLDHTPKANTTVVYGATCTEEGRKTYTCATCNEKITEKTGEKALGHNYAFEPATCIKGAAIVCTRGCALKGTEAGYSDFYKTLTDDQKKAVDKNAPLGHDFVGTVVNKNGKYYALCRTCGEKEVTFDSKANTITSVDTLQEVWTVTVDPTTKIITVGEKSKVEQGKTPLSIVSIEKGVHQATTNPQANNITVSSTGTTVTVTETADKVGSTTNPDGETKRFFCLVLDLGIAKDKVKVTSGNYTIENDDLNCVDQWTTSSNGNQLLVWLSAEKCGANGITITFSDADNVKDPVDITFKFVEAK